MKKILFVCNDFIGNVMAGPGIRYWEMAHAYARKGHPVIVLSRHLEPGFSGHGAVSIGRASVCNLFSSVRRSDQVILTGRPLSILFSLFFGKKIIFDQYDPVIFEFLDRPSPTFDDRFQNRVMMVLWKLRQRLILRFGDGYIVANEKQKDFLIGQLAILGYLNKLDSVTVLPFGLPETIPVKKRSVLRGTKIRESDFLLVWGGGIWDWFDPFTLLRAMAIVRSFRDDIKIYFPGLRPPSPDAQKMAVNDAFLREARKLGLLDTAVFVNTEWYPYEQRADYLLEADAGVSLHRDSMETRFAFRTRILDYLWTGLPILASKGDCWADVIEKEQLGITVVPGDVDGVAKAIMSMADDGPFRARCREKIRAVAEKYTWNILVESLIID